MSNRRASSASADSDVSEEGIESGEEEEEEEEENEMGANANSASSPASPRQVIGRSVTPVKVNQLPAESASSEEKQSSTAGKTDLQGSQTSLHSLDFKLSPEEFKSPGNHKSLIIFH